MRGLTDAERVELSQLCDPIVREFYPGDPCECVLERLADSGRALRTSDGGYIVSTVGREALRVDALVRARLGGAK